VAARREQGVAVLRGQGGAARQGRGKSVAASAPERYLTCVQLNKALTATQNQC
jgi:hypothetical protein